MENEKNELQSYSPHGLISQALAQNVPIETLERLMDLQERWQAGQAKTAYLKAMSKFQSICPELKKTKKVNYPSKTGGNVKYEYAPLATITKSIREALSACGLSYRWEFEDKDGLIICYCIVSHIDGHSEKTSMSAGKDTTGNKNEIQSIGSTRTYLQRNTLIGALGLSTADEDNDGRTSDSRAPIPEPKSKTPPSGLLSPEVLRGIGSAKTEKALNDIYISLKESDRPLYIEILSKRKAELTKK